jgi:hypothetical protein
VSSEVLYRERLWPSFAVPSFLMFMGGSLAIAYQHAYHGNSGLITVILSLALTLWLTLAMSPAIEVTPYELRLGKARINRSLLGAIASLDAQQTKHALGQGAHADALIISRAGIEASVVVEITDESDPHPYWQFSSRNPEMVLRALHS